MTIKNRLNKLETAQTERENEAKNVRTCDCPDIVIATPGLDGNPVWSYDLCYECRRTRPVRHIVPHSADV